MEIIAGIIGIAAGFFIAGLLLRARHRAELANKNMESSNELSILDERLKSKEAQIEELKSIQMEREKKIEELTTEKLVFAAKVSELETIVSKERKLTDEKLEILEESKEKLSNSFKALANDIFDEKSKKFRETNKDSLEALLNPLSEKIKNFEKKVEDTHEKNIKDRSTLVEKISQLHDLNQQLSKDADSLANALKGETKTQGNWGEMILERILESSGLRKGWEYETQKSMTSSEGKKQLPDVIVKLPENRSVIIDSKVSLNAYERHCRSEDDSEKAKALNEHLASIKRHISELSGKNYQNLYEIKSLDFVLMFVPIESAFAAAIRFEHDLFLDALRKNIVIVTPSTLLATLRTLSHIWKQEFQNRNAAEIARQSGALYDKFNGFVKDLESIGNRLDQTQQSYSSAMNKLKTGKGNLIKRAEDIKQLGAKTKSKLPEKLLDEAGALEQVALLSEAGEKNSKLDATPEKI